MKALSIRQPWAWLILHAGKDIENRSWHTAFRGRILIHAGKKIDRADYRGACDLTATISPEIRIPSAEVLPRGGIVGSVEVVDCVDISVSPWYCGENFGLVLARPKPLPLMPLKGALGFFEVTI